MNIKKIDLVKLQNILLWMFTGYTASVCLAGSLLGFNHGPADKPLQLYRYLFYIVCVLMIIAQWQKYRWQHVRWLAVLAVSISLLDLVIARQNYPLILFIMVVALHRLDMRKLAWHGWIGMLAGFIITLVLTGSGVLENWSYARETGRIRYSLGFYYPTIASTCWFLILVTGFYARQRSTKVEWLLNFLTTIMVYIATDSKTGLVLSLFVLATMVLDQKKDIWKKTPSRKGTCIAISLTPVILLVLFMIIWWLYVNRVPLGLRINRLLNTRVQIAAHGIHDYGIHALGQKIQWNGNGGLGYVNDPTGFHYNFVDNAYLKMMFDYGLLFLVLFMIMQCTSIYLALQRQDGKFVFIALLMAVWAIMEPDIVDLGKNVFLAGYAEILFRGPRIIKSEK